MSDGGEMRGGREGGRKGVEMHALDVTALVKVVLRIGERGGAGREEGSMKWIKKKSVLQKRGKGGGGNKFRW